MLQFGSHANPGGRQGAVPGPNSKIDKRKPEEGSSPPPPRNEAELDGITGSPDGRPPLTSLPPVSLPFGYSTQSFHLGLHSQLAFGTKSQLLVTFLHGVSPP